MPVEAPVPKPPMVTCANCGMTYKPGTAPPCPLGPLGTADWSNEMLVFMRCTVGRPGDQQSKQK